MKKILALVAALVVAPAFAQKLPQPWDFSLPATGIVTTIIALPGGFNSAGLITSYSTGSNGVCGTASLGLFSVSLFLSKPGVCTLTASNPGNAQYEPLSVTMSMTVTWPVTFTLPQQPIRLGDSAAAEFAWQFNSAPGSFSCAVDWGDPPGAAASGATSLGSIGSYGGAFCDAAHTYGAAGIYGVAAIFSASPGISFQQGEVFVYDPAAHLSGSGTFDSPPGAFTRAPSLAGSFTFNIASFYAPGATHPTGVIALDLQRGDMPITFEANWQYVLVASGSNARILGTGFDQSGEEFLFEMVFAAPDRIRVAAWDAAGNLVYDTQPGDSLDSAATTLLTAGNIAVTH